MLRNLRLAETICNVGALLSFLLMVLADSEKEEKEAIVMIALLLMILCMFIASRVRKRIYMIEQAKHELLPVMAERARVLKRRVGYRYSGGGRSGTVRSGPPMYYIVFLTEQENRMELFVTRDVYFANPEGKTGCLRYRGDEFISFE